MATVPRPRRRKRGRFLLSVARYDAMVEAGILTEEDRVELIAGELVTKMSRNRRHIQRVRKLIRALERLGIPGWFVTKEDPIVVSPWSKPEPDAALVRGTLDDYDDRDVAAADVALVVEVADSSLGDDRGVMLSMYAESGIPAYWILNLRDGQLEVYTHPSGQTGPIGYRHCQILRPGQDAELSLDGTALARIAVADLLG